MAMAPEKRAMSSVFTNCMITETGTPNMMALSTPVLVDSATATPMVPPVPTSRPAVGPMAVAPIHISCIWEPMIRPLVTSPRMSPTRKPVTMGSRSLHSPSTWPSSWVATTTKPISTDCQSVIMEISLPRGGGPPQPGRMPRTAHC